MWAAEYEIPVKSYRGDNSVYKSVLFKEDLEQKHQKMSYSGMGSHSQNVVTERTIQTLITSARTMMLHQALLSPEKIDIHLWSFALDKAVYLHNHLLSTSSFIAPLKIYKCSKLNTSVLGNENDWECPAYILDPKLQDSKNFPKWDP